MELPIEYKNERAEYLEIEANKYQADELCNMTNEDFMLLGKYIQVYFLIGINMNGLFNKLESVGIIRTKPKIKVNIQYILDKLIGLMNEDLVESSKVDEVICKPQ